MRMNAIMNWSDNLEYIEFDTLHLRYIVVSKSLLLHPIYYYRNQSMAQDNNIPSSASIPSDIEQRSYESICTCKICNHGSARDCLKSGCKCCKKENHSMIMNGMEGFYPTDK